MGDIVSDVAARDLVPGIDASTPVMMRHPMPDVTVKELMIDVALRELMPDTAVRELMPDVTIRELMFKRELMRLCLWESWCLRLLRELILL